MMKVKLLTSAAAFSAACLMLLWSTAEGRRAYWKRVHPVMTMYHEALTWDADSP